MEPVTPAQLALYLGIAPEVIEDARAALLLSLAVEACEEFVTPLPDRARGIVLDVASTAYTAPPGPGGQQTAGPYGAPVPPGGITLSARQRDRLRRLAGRRGRAYSIGVIAGGPRGAAIDGEQGADPPGEGYDPEEGL